MKNLTPAALAAAAAGDLHNFVVASTPGGIEAQEALEQQRATAAFQRLPKEVHGATWNQLQGLGFKVLGDLDELFYRIEAPKGWTIRPTSHSMHSDVLDEQGRIRMGMFYKGAFYDRRADLRVCRRYTSHKTYEGPCFAYVEDAAKPGAENAIFKTAELPEREPNAAREEALARYAAEDALHDEAEAWLDANKPEHKDPLAYW